jgi:HEAT repeat protein
MLWSSDGEERVRAAWWLGERGVRQAGPQIVAAMNDGGTLRPCQLAHNLGKLGDERWVDQLLQASRKPSSLDLRVCATDALGDLSSARAIDGLMDVYRKNLAPVSALESLGKIAEPSTLPFLRSVADHPRNKVERRVALRAIECAEIMSQVDPVPALIRRVESSTHGRFLDSWAVRKLVDRGDARAVSIFAQAIGRPNALEDDQIILAAALLTVGEAGTAALRSAAADGPAAMVAHEALAWSEQVTPAGSVAAIR